MLRVYSVLESLAVIAVAVSTSACGAKDARTTDSANVGVTATAPATQATPAPTAGDPDHNFLRLMSDHHKGLILMLHETIESKRKLAVKPLAKRLDKEQDDELDTMMTMLERDYKDPYAPKVMTEHQAMADELKGRSGADFNRSFLVNVIKQHGDGVKMINDYLPKARKARIKQMAERMKATQTQEIAQMEGTLATMKP